MLRGRVFVFIVMLGLIAAFFAFDLDRFFRLEYFKAQQALIDDFYRNHPLGASGAYFAVYVAVAALSLPGAALMTLVAGAIFGRANRWAGGMDAKQPAHRHPASVRGARPRIVRRDVVRRAFTNVPMSLAPRRQSAIPVPPTLELRPALRAARHRPGHR